MKLKINRKYIIWAITAMVVLLFISSIAIYSHYKNTLEDMSIERHSNGGENSEDDIDEKDPKTVMFEEPFIIHLYGIDQRADQGDEGRPDTLMLALIDPQLVKVTLISIPRDSYVSIPGRTKKDKINHAYPIGGVDLTIETIEKWFDIDIYAHVAIDFEGFIELVDLVGGVDVYVDRSIQYDSVADGTHIRLEKGQQVLDGKNALDFVRARLDNRGQRYYTSDYKRMERQQLVLKELGSEIVSLKSLPRIFNMMSVVGNNVKTTLTPDELDFLVRKFSRFNTEKLETTSVLGEALYLNGVWYEDVPDSEVERIQQLISDFLERKPTVAVDDTTEKEEAEKDKE
jgi:LCP family protein required for cell wall assembly